jgi:uncharacterized hydrophobic protein (TIGR00271 family)
MPSQKRKQKRQKYQTDIAPQARFDLVYVVLMASAGALAPIAFLTSSVPILIGTMVIAPIMPPLVLMSIGLANGTVRAFLRGGAIALSGLMIAVAATVLTTWLLNVTGVSPADLHLSPMLIERVSPGWYSVVAAFAAGTAGALAVLRKKSDTLVGVVASIALVPSAAGTGVAAVVGAWHNVAGGLLMLLINTGMIVLMGWIVFTSFSTGGE